MALNRDPVLIVWQAMNLLDKVHVRSESPEISNILVESETILFSLVVALVRRTKKTGPIFSERGFITH